MQSMFVKLHEPKALICEIRGTCFEQLNPHGLDLFDFKIRGTWFEQFKLHGPKSPIYEPTGTKTTIKPTFSYFMIVLVKSFPKLTFIAKWRRNIPEWLKHLIKCH